MGRLIQLWYVFLGFASLHRSPVRTSSVQFTHLHRLYPLQKQCIPIHRAVELYQLDLDLLNPVGFSREGNGGPTINDSSTALRSGEYAGR